MTIKTNKETIIKEVAKSDNDTGSMSIQVALITSDIKRLSGHFKKFPKDYASKRGLIKMIAQRRKALTYLEKNNPDEYKSLIKRLELRK